MIFYDVMMIVHNVTFAMILQYVMIVLHNVMMKSFLLHGFFYYTTQSRIQKGARGLGVVKGVGKKIFLRTKYVDTHNNHTHICLFTSFLF